MHGTAEDHHAFNVEVELECCVSEAGGRKKKKPKQINSQHLHDPWLCQGFETKLRWFDPGHVCVDRFHGLLVEFVRETASTIFGPAPVEPKSPWVSKEAFAISKMRSRVRRTMNGAKKIPVIACLEEAFWAWRAKLGVVPFAGGLRPVIVDGLLWRRRMTGGPCSCQRDGLNVQPTDSSRNLDGA